MAGRPEAIHLYRLSMPTLAAWIGAKALLGIEPSEEEVLKRIRTSSLREVFEVVGKIGAILYNSGRTLSTELEICSLLFTAETAERIRRGVQEATAGSNNTRAAVSEVVLFTNRSLLALLQIAIKECDAESNERTGTLHERIGEALLIVNDLIVEVPGEPNEEDSHSNEGLRKWVYYLTMLAPEPGHDPAVHLVTRTVDMYLSPNIDLRGDRTFIDLPALFLEATGLDVEAYALAFLSLVGLLYAVTLETMAHQGVIIPRTFFENDRLSFSRAQIDSFLALGGEKAQSLANFAHTHYSRGEFKPFQILPFEKSPLAIFEQDSVCLSLPLLERKFTAGLYHLLLNAQNREQRKEAGSPFQSFIGKVFEKYVTRAFQRMAAIEGERMRPKPRKHEATSYWIAEGDIRRALRNARGQEPPSCDGILVIGSSAILVESKARMFSLGERSGEDIEGFFDRLEEIAIKGAKQLDSMVGHIMNGRLNSAGINLSRLREITPIVVSLDRVLMNRPLRDWIDSRLKSEGYLSRRKLQHVEINPLEILDVSDLEWLELAVEKGGVSTIMVLRRKRLDRVGQALSLLDWGQATHEGRQRAGDRISYHSSRYKEIMDGGLRFFREHARDIKGLETR